MPPHQTCASTSRLGFQHPVSTATATMTMTARFMAGLRARAISRYPLLMAHNGGTGLQEGRAVRIGEYADRNCGLHRHGADTSLGNAGTLNQVRKNHKSFGAGLLSAHFPSTDRTLIARPQLGSGHTRTRKARADLTMPFRSWRPSLPGHILKADNQQTTTSISYSVAATRLTACCWESTPMG